MKQCCVFILYFLLFCPLANHAQTPYFAWTPTAEKAYQKAVELRLSEAENQLFLMAQREPDNYIRLLIDNYVDFFRIFINEDPEEFKALEIHKKERLDLLKNSDESSPWHLYCQAAIRLHWALVRIKFEEYGTAFFEVNKAFKLLSKNAETFPDFMPNKKDLGILHAIAGTIPDNYKWAVEWISSLEGSLVEGQAELEEVLAYSKHKPFIFEKEAQVLYAYLLLHLGNQPDQAWKIINSSKLSPAHSPMDCFVLANIAQQTGRNDEAINILLQQPNSNQFHRFHYLNFMLGASKLRRLDADADVYFKKFLDQFKGQNFIKEGHQRLGWHYLIQGNEQGYWEQMELCKSKGNTLVGSDQSALNEAERNNLPNRLLLKARNLFDGGYYLRAKRTLDQVSPGQLSDPHDQIEYSYRKGRILHALKDYNKAIALYQKTINQGRSEPWYYACRAALECGHIYEELKQYELAKIYFKDCQSIKPEEHSTGLHQMAKAGLKRVE